jgi:hypothetical protein
MTSRSVILFLTGDMGRTDPPAIAALADRTLDVARRAPWTR